MRNFIPSHLDKEGSRAFFSLLASKSKHNRPLPFSLEGERTSARSNAQSPHGILKHTEGRILEDRQGTVSTSVRRSNGKHPPDFRRP